MGANRRKAVKERVKRLKEERKRQAKKVADRLLGKTRFMSIDHSDWASDKTTYTWKCSKHYNK